MGNIKNKDSGKRSLGFVRIRLHHVLMRLHLFIWGLSFLMCRKCDQSPVLAEIMAVELRTAD